jgi:hypothetical protein
VTGRRVRVGSPRRGDSSGKNHRRTAPPAILITTPSGLYDGLLRRTNNAVWNGSALLAQTTNSYDTAGRLAVVSSQVRRCRFSLLQLFDNDGVSGKLCSQLSQMRAEFVAGERIAES